MKPRNPNWSRDELIVTLDFYVQHSPSIPDKKSSEIFSLSEFLNRLQLKLGGETGETFRNPNGVYMKLMNFRRFDPSYRGKGLVRGGKDEQIVWNLYSSNPAQLHKISESIRTLVINDSVLPSAVTVSDEEESEAEEGKILTRTHRYRERDKKIVERKKNHTLKTTGKLACQICEFDFAKIYGLRGEGFIECHHTKPVSELDAGAKTKLSELLLVCSNCHRMIHRRKPWLSVEELKQQCLRK
jgi:5-methylcytosine-specific restriction protein A